MAESNTVVQLGYQGPAGPPGPAPAGTGLVKVTSGVASTLPAGTSGQVLQTDGLGAPYWGSAPAAPDATDTSKGSVKLAGSLGGTADLPTVTGLDGDLVGAADIGATSLICTPGAFTRCESYRTETTRTNATPVTVATLDLPTTNEFGKIVVEVIARRSDAGSEKKIFNLARSVQNVAGLLGGFTVEGTDATSGTGGATVSFSNTGTQALVQVAGVSAQTWKFAVFVDFRTVV